MLLSEIALSGFSGTAPTPVERVAINKYLVNNDLFNLIEFVNIGMGTAIGNIQVTVLTYDTPDAAKFRRIGEEYDISNNPPIPVTLVLKQLGGAFQTDRVLTRAFSGTRDALDNWTEQQIRQKINSIINSFAKYFIQGDSAVNDKEFDGLDKFFTNHAGQVLDVLEVDGGISPENAMDIEKYINTIISKMDEVPTCVITTRTTGKPFLQTLEQYRHRGIEAIEVNGRKYHMFKGIPIVALEDNCFTEESLEAGIPIIFAKFDEERGIRVAVPMNPGIGNRGAVLDIVRPVDGTGVMVKEAGVELCGVPIIVDPFCAAKGTILEKKTP